jgi:two-component system CitB family response regulator
VIRTVVVDDDARVADLHCLYLQQLEDFEVVGVAPTGREALDLVATLEPDLVLLDIYLPDMSGIDVLRRLREQQRQVDVMTITAAKDVATLRAAIHGGSIHYMIKPFTFTAFRERLESYAVVSSRLRVVGEASQDDVNRLYGIVRTDEGAELPKGLSRTTCNLVMETLESRSTAVSSTEVAEIAGLSRVTARRYLDHLVRTGFAEVSLQYGAPGRPEHQYRLARSG